MIKSMTGFGSAQRYINGISIDVEISSLNGRFLDSKIKLPQCCARVENVIHQKIKDRCYRGKLSVVISVKFDSFSSNGKESLDRKKFEQYVSMLNTLKKEYGHTFKLEKVIDFKELILTGEPEEVDLDEVMNVFEDAMAQFLLMREREGELMADDIFKRLTRVEELISPLREFCRNNIPRALKDYKRKIMDLLNGVEIDNTRLIQEAAILAEKMDISEECVRLESHVTQFRELLHQEEPVGKRLNFLLQEMNREVNTIGSKNNQLEITQMVVEMKDEIEKIKEQVQNIL